MKCKGKYWVDDLRKMSLFWLQREKEEKEGEGEREGEQGEEKEKKEKALQ